MARQARKTSIKELSEIKYNLVNEVFRMFANNVSIEDMCAIRDITKEKIMYIIFANKRKPRDVDAWRCRTFKKAFNLFENGIEPHIVQKRLNVPIRLVNSLKQAYNKKDISFKIGNNIVVDKGPDKGKRGRCVDIVQCADPIILPYAIIRLAETEIAVLAKWCSKGV